MPHLTIEYSKEIENQTTQLTLLKAVDSGAKNSELFNPKDIKIRCIPLETTWMGGNDAGKFIHVIARILSGRTTEQKNKLSSEIFKQLELLNPSIDSLTVEICDIDRTTHQPNPDA